MFIIQSCLVPSSQKLCWLDAKLELRGQYQNRASHYLVPSLRGTPLIWSPRTLTVPEVTGGSRVQKVSYTYPYIQSWEKVSKPFSSQGVPSSWTSSPLDKLIPLLHDSTFNKSSQWVLFFLCLATFTSGPATQKPLLTYCSKEKRLGCYLGKWKKKLPTAKEQKTNYCFNKLSCPLYMLT